MKIIFLSSFLIKSIIIYGIIDFINKIVDYFIGNLLTLLEFWFIIIIIKEIDMGCGAVCGNNSSIY